MAGYKCPGVQLSGFPISRELKPVVGMKSVFVEIPVIPLTMIELWS